MKTNKSYSKRLRLTRKGKIVARVTGQNHFNAKDSGKGRQRKHRDTSFELTVKDRSRFLSK